MYTESGRTWHPNTDLHRQFHTTCSLQLDTTCFCVSSDNVRYGVWPHVAPEHRITDSSTLRESKPRHHLLVSAATMYVTESSRTWHPNTDLHRQFHTTCSLNLDTTCFCVSSDNTPLASVSAATMYVTESGRTWHPNTDLHRQFHTTCSLQLDTTCFCVSSDNVRYGVWPHVAPEHRSTQTVPHYV
ncbi:hypothetical protein J6590_078833 [Homalodisca vitripennis]|nr:hypothetical protein J6590_078833 [Homalodisca vitripennis]